MNTTTTAAPILSTESINAQKTLARLLSEEDIQVVIGNYSTAFFNTETRVLGLPSWSLNDPILTAPMAKSVIDLLTGHEVGHARHTPHDGIARFKERFADKGVPFSICNIIEDIRIERLILNDYPGLIYGFKQGYQYFIDSDKFEIEDKDTSTMNFIDRLNIRSKLRRTDIVPLSDTEEAFYQKCLRAETFEDVLDLVEEAVNMVENEKLENGGSGEGEGEGEGENPNPQSGGDTNDDPSAGDWNSTDDDDQEGEEKNSDSTDGSTGGDCKEGEGETDKFTTFSNRGEELENGNMADTGSDPDPNVASAPMVQNDDLHDELFSETQDALERNINEMADSDPHGHIMNTPSDKSLLDSVIPMDMITESRRNRYPDHYAQTMTKITDDWEAFKTESKKSVSILAKEFERRKAAYQYSRATTARTGVIDINKLHSYKYDDQIFKSVTALADAKSHGMIFFIDYSGSMQGMIHDVICQTIQLVMFCKQVGIPFDVYGFTSPSYNSGEYRNENENLPGVHLDLSMTSIRHLISSSCKKSEFELILKELWATTHYQIGGIYDQMGATPLNETLLVAHAIVDKFQKKHQVQKTNVIILSDGDGGSVHTTHNRELNKNTSGFSKADDRFGIRSNGKMVFRGKTINLGGGFSSGYKALLHSLKTNFNVNIIGFFLHNRSTLSKRDRYDIARKISRNNQLDNNGNMTENNPKLRIDLQEDAVQLVEKAMAKSRKLKTNFITIPDFFGYDQYFVLKGRKSIEIAEEEDDFDVDQDLTSARARNNLAKQFTKIAGSSRKTRIFLTTFAEAIS